MNPHKPKTLLITILIIAAALLPAALLRDLNPLNELNYLAIADDALKRGTFFAFYMDGAPYADKPPLYLWLCMINQVLGTSPFLMLFLGSVLPFLVIIYLLAGDLKAAIPERNAGLIALSLCAPLFFTALALIGRMDMLFVMFIVIAYRLLLKRAAEVLSKGESRLYEWAIPISIFLGLFTKGPYAVIFILIALFLFLFIKGGLRSYFKIFKPKFFLIILAFTALWVIAVLMDGGISYAQNLFIEQSSERLSGSLGHPKPLYWYALNFWYLASPLSLSLACFVILDIKNRGALLSLPRAACLTMAAAVILVISIPSSKLEIYLLPALPYVAGYVLLSFKDYGGHEGALRINRILLGAQALLLVLLFPLHFFFTNRHPLVSEPLLEGALLAISLGGAAACFLCLKNQLLKAFASIGVGVLGFCFLAGLAMPQANPYLGMGAMASQASQGIDEGFSSTVCVLTYRNGDNFYLYDPRFKVVSTDKLDDPRCQGAQIILSRKHLERNPDLKEKLLKKGGIMVGDSLYLKNLPEEK